MKQAAPSCPQGKLAASSTKPHASDLISIA